jgi:hypothetical protein
MSRLEKMLFPLEASYTERHQSLRNHTQRLAWLTLYGGFKINDSKGEYAIWHTSNSIDLNEQSW